MKPLILTMEKIGSYKERCTIDFEKLTGRGLFLINGPTGSGKTTIFDGVCAALFGCASGDKRDKYDLISDYDNAAEKGRPKKGMVELTFLFHGKKYCIKRVFKKSLSGGIANECNLYELTEDGEREIVLKSEKEYDRYIIDMLGVDINRFRQVAMLAQGSFRQFIDANDGDIERILKSIFKTQKYESFSDAVKVKINNLKAEYESQERSINEMLSSDNLDEESKAEFDNGVLISHKLATVERAVEKGKKTIEDIKAQLEKTNMSIEGLNTEKALADNIKMNFDKKVELEENIKSLTNGAESISHLKRVVDEAKRAEKAMPYINKLNDAKSNLYIREKNAEIHRQQKVQYDLEEKKLKRDCDENEKRQLCVSRLNVEAKEIRRIMPLFDEGEQLKKDEKENTVLLKKTENIINKLLEKGKLYESERNELEALKEKIGGCSVEKQRVIGLLYSLETAENSINDVVNRYNAYFAAIQAYEAAVEEYKAEYALFDLADNGCKLAEKAFFNEQAGIIAEGLEQGKPCPVCGTYGIKEVRKPAKRSPNAPSREEIEKMKADVDKKRQDTAQKSEAAAMKKNAVNTALEELKSNAASLGMEYKDIYEIKDLAEIRLKNNKDEKERLKAKKLYYENQESELDKTEKRLDELKKLLRENAEGIEEENKELTDLKIKQRGIAEKIAAVQRETGAYTSKADAQKRLDAAEAEENKLKKEIDTVQKKYNDAVSNSAAVEEAIKNDRAEIENAHKRVLDSGEELNAILAENGFKDSMQVLAAGMDRDSLKAEEERIKKLDESTMELKQINKSLEGKQMPDLQNIEARLFALNEERKKIMADLTAASVSVEANKKMVQRVKESLAHAQSINEEYKAVRRLAAINFKGFERYVQGYYLDRILVGANRRLAKMTDGNYTLHRPFDNAGKSNNMLSLWVHDRTTNTDRAASTLSGGESFKAALSLALAMSDEIQNTKSGIEINTVFVDEGFGSLDETSREQAVRVLMDMAERDNRFVGIISHVSELKTMIESRIDVVKDHKGSRAEVVF